LGQKLSSLQRRRQLARRRGAQAEVVPAAKVRHTCCEIPRAAATTPESSPLTAMTLSPPRLRRGVLKGSKNSPPYKGGDSLRSVEACKQRWFRQCGWAHLLRDARSEKGLNPFWCSWSQGFHGCWRTEMSALRLHRIFNSRAFGQSASTYLENGQLPLQL